MNCGAKQDPAITDMLETLIVVKSRPTTTQTCKIWSVIHSSLILRNKAELL